MKPNYKVFLFLVTVVIFCKIDLSFGNQKIEPQVGPFRFSGPPQTESKLVSEFGEGYVLVEKVGDKIISKKHIFWVPEQAVWLQIGLSHVLDKEMERIVEAVLVTKKKLCNEDRRYIPIKKLPLLVTSKGIKINDSIDKVIEKYGKPSVSKVIGKDKVFSVLDEELKLKQGEVLRYLQKHPSNELNFAEFYFEKKKLHSILISESE
jgi:hypothetical protein